MTPTVNPIVPWPLIVLGGLVIVALTLWAYARRLRGTEGRWRWVALGLRLAAILMCLLAVLKPALLVMQKVQQDVALVFLLDDSSSMGITDEANNRSRFEVARTTLAAGRESVKSLGPKLQLRTMRFNDRAQELPDLEKAQAKGAITALGTALDEVLKQTAGTKLLSVVVLSDGASNSGMPPLLAAQRLKAQQVPVVAVGFGSSSAGSASRDLVARDLVAGPSVFIKNQPAIRGTITARGYPNQEAEVELYVEDAKRPVATKKVRITQPNQVIPITDLKWIPDKAGETKLTLRIKPQEGELVPTNNEISTYVTVQSGGLNVLYVQGPNFSWEYKYLIRALDSAPEIQATLRVVRRPTSEDPRALPDEELAPGKYDVIILGDVPADLLSRVQRAALRQTVQRGAGLMMLGGRSSFGAGGWAGTELAEILPTNLRSSDGQMEPEDGLRVVPELGGLENFVLRLGATRADTERLWAELPKISGSNRLGPAKRAAIILARADGPEGEPIMVAQDVDAGRVLAFGGETWPWFTSAGEAQASHRKFWRQAILWLAHKEDEGADQIKLALDRRRVSVGSRLDLTVTARDAKGQPMTDLRYETVVEPVAPPAANPAVPAPAKSESAPPSSQAVELFNQDREARGSYYATGKPGEYRVTVKGFRGDQAVGSDVARFLVFQDDRELENPAADLALLRQIADLTGGKLLSPEQLGKHLRTLNSEQLTETVVQKEVRLWDNWPFFLIFVLILSLEWWLRKRNGWV